jgi:hypothetical protein
MSHLRNALADYLTMRRALGYKMDKAERLLGQFVTFAEVAARPMSGPGQRWPGRQSPLALMRSGPPGGWPRSVSSLGTCARSTRGPRCRPTIFCRREYAAQHRISTRPGRLLR